MAKGKPNPVWKEKVLEWQSSGKTVAVWCKENKIPYTTFLGWKSRFRTSNEKENGFLELKDPIQFDPGVTLEYNGIKIHLKHAFNPSVLKKCLDCLRSLLC